jgi:hypothetical protein
VWRDEHEWDGRGKINPIDKTPLAQVNIKERYLRVGSFKLKRGGEGIAPVLISPLPIAAFSIPRPEFLSLGRMAKSSTCLPGICSRRSTMECEFRF